jgi:hypothetical protein
LFVTGTLTSDEMVFEGVAQTCVVDPKAETPQLAQHEDINITATHVLAACQSLVVVDDKMVNIWHDSVNNWHDSVNNWHDSVNNWHDSVDIWHGAQNHLSRIVI